MSKPQNTTGTFTAKIYIPGDKNPRVFINCKLINGKLVQLANKGVGKGEEKGGFTPGGDGDSWVEYKSYRQVYKPLLSKEKIKQAGKNPQEVQMLLSKDSSIEPQDFHLVEPYLFEMGENPGGYIVVNADEEKEKQKSEKLAEVAAKKVPIYIGKGYFGLTISERLPADVFAKLKPYASYHSGNEDDLEWLDEEGFVDVKSYEVKGWYYTKEVIAILSGLGFPLMYGEHAIKDEKDLAEAKRLREQKREGERKIELDKRRLIDSINEQLRQLPQQYLSKEECEKLQNLANFSTDKIGWKGGDIYGGGKWMKKDENYLYLIYNNGADGDDWSRNNYNTGGAGAIAYRTPLTEAVIQLLTQIESL